MVYKLFILLFLLIVSCGKKPKLPILVIGHGGNGLNFPGSIYHDNSNEAMDLALSTPNVDGVELDLRMAADGTLWLYHDEQLGTETKSSGCVGAKNSNQLLAIRYKSFNKEKLAKLDQIEVFLEGEKLLFLDIKHSNSCQNNSEDVNQYLASLSDWKVKVNNPDKRVFVVLNNRDWIEPFIFSGWNVLFSSDENDLRDKLMADFTEIRGFVCKNKLCTKKKVDDLKNKGKGIYLYEVRSPKALKELREKNPTGVMSDDLQGAIVEFK